MEKKCFYIVVGLGNPGETYDSTRHNVGFMVVDHLAEGAAWKKSTTRSTEEVRLHFNGRNVILVKPRTWMNASGRAVRAVMQFYHADPGALLVIHDDVDLPLGTVRMQEGRGAAGHKGVMSVFHHLTTKQFTRIRCGVGHPLQGNVDDYVLSPFSPGEKGKVRAMVADVARRIARNVLPPDQDGTLA